MLPFLLIPASFVMIQDAQRPPEPPRDVRPEGRGMMRNRPWAERGPQGKGDLRDTLRRALLKRMQKGLNLTDAQITSIEKKMIAHDAELKGFNDKLEALRPKIQDIMQGNGSTDEKNTKLKPLIEEWFSLRQQRDVVSRSQFEQTIRAGLDPMQQMRLTMGLEKFRDELRNRLEDRLQQRGPGMNRPGMNPGPRPGWGGRQR
jgi:Spy/CpxP family protein refolding chaperone